MRSHGLFPSWLRRILIFVFAGISLLLLAVVIRAAYAFRDRNPGYQLSLHIEGRAASANPRPLQVGFGRRKINPELSNPEHPIWLAGFSNGRAATGQHDDLWAVACVIDDGYNRLGITAIDSIGIFHDDVIDVRRRLPAEWKLSYTLLCSTHNHSTPDLMGLWGPGIFKTGVDRNYLEHVKEQVGGALGDAVTALQPARLAFYQIPLSPDGLVADSRKPEVFDPDLRLMVFSHPTTGNTLGTLVTWADHPETPWSHNTEITADFPGVLRESLEKGIIYDGQVRIPGLGGIHVYVNGAIPGLMTTNPATAVHDPFLNRDFTSPSHEKSRALGNRLAQAVLTRIGPGPAESSASIALSIQARTIEMPIANVNFLLAPVLGLLNRGHVRWKTLRTEVALVTIGDATVACVPGEIYPELVNGGIERAPGGDFDLDPVEVPPIRELMSGKIKFVFGLANDEIGYIIPKSEWDEKPPYLYGSERPIYGEVNSVGPETAPLLHKAFRELIDQQARGALPGRLGAARGVQIECGFHAPVLSGSGFSRGFCRPR